MIRIFNPIDGSHLQELRRGFEYAQIYSLSFDPLGKWLAISCDSGTIHIFNLKQTKEEYFSEFHRFLIIFFIEKKESSIMGKKNS